jgi:malate dehydrogenase
MRWRRCTHTCCTTHAGVPVVIGVGGVERVIEIELNPSEKAAFERSVAHVRELVEAMDKVLASSV